MSAQVSVEGKEKLFSDEAAFATINSLLQHKPELIQLVIDFCSDKIQESEHDILIKYPQIVNPSSVEATKQCAIQANAIDDVNSAYHYHRKSEIIQACIEKGIVGFFTMLHDAKEALDFFDRIGPPPGYDDDYWSKLIDLYKEGEHVSVHFKKVSLLNQSSKLSKNGFCFDNQHSICHLKNLSSSSSYLNNPIQNGSNTSHLCHDNISMHNTSDSSSVLVLDQFSDFEATISNLKEWVLNKYLMIPKSSEESAKTLNIEAFIVKPQIEERGIAVLDKQVLNAFKSQSKERTLLIQEFAQTGMHFLLNWFSAISLSARFATLEACMDFIKLENPLHEVLSTRQQKMILPELLRFDFFVEAGHQNLMNFMLRIAYNNENEFVYWDKNKNMIIEKIHQNGKNNQNENQNNDDVNGNDDDDESKEAMLDKLRDQFLSLKNQLTHQSPSHQSPTHQSPTHQSSTNQSHTNQSGDCNASSESPDSHKANLKALLHWIFEMQQKHSQHIPALFFLEYALEDIIISETGFSEPIQNRLRTQRGDFAQFVVPFEMHRTRCLQLFALSLIEKCLKACLHVPKSLPVSHHQNKKRNRTK